MGNPISTPRNASNPDQNACSHSPIPFLVHISINGKDIDSHTPVPTIPSRIRRAVFQDGNCVVCHGLYRSHLHYHFAHHFICGSDLLDTSHEVKRGLLAGYSADHAGGFRSEVSAAELLRCWASQRANELGTNQSA